jgi:hypothetical protein
MTEYVMTRLAVSRYKSKNGTPPICRFCGEAGKVCERNTAGWRNNRKMLYTHKKCDESRPYLMWFEKWRNVVFESPCHFNSPSFSKTMRPLQCELPEVNRAMFLLCEPLLHLHFKQQFFLASCVMA